MRSKVVQEAGVKVHSIIHRTEHACLQKWQHRLPCLSGCIRGLPQQEPVQEMMLATPRQAASVHHARLESSEVTSLFQLTSVCKGPS